MITDGITSANINDSKYLFVIDMYVYIKRENEEAEKLRLENVRFEFRYEK